MPQPEKSKTLNYSMFGYEAKKVWVARLKTLLGKRLADRKYGNWLSDER
jgi:hypothetical protein